MNREEMKKELMKFIDEMYYIQYYGKEVKRVVFSERQYKRNGLSLQYNEFDRELVITYGPNSLFKGVLIKDIVK